MTEFVISKMDDKIINKYFFYKNQEINRRYAAKKKILKKIDHYQWWFQGQKQRTSFLITKEKK